MKTTTRKPTRLRRIFWDDIQSGFGIRGFGTLRRLYLGRLVIEWQARHVETWWDYDREYFEHLGVYK